MANRTTVSSVKEIFDTALSDAIIETFITVANGLVTTYLGGSDLSDSELEEIERFLSAHLASTMRDPVAKQEAVTGSVGVNVSYMLQGGLGLDGSPFGQVVKLLDRTGLLSLQKKQASVYAVPSFDS